MPSQGATRTIYDFQRKSEAPFPSESERSTSPTQAFWLQHDCTPGRPRGRAPPGDRRHRQATLLSQRAVTSCGVDAALPAVRSESPQGLSLRIPNTAAARSCTRRPRRARPQGGPASSETFIPNLAATVGRGALLQPGHDEVCEKKSQRREGSAGVEHLGLEFGLDGETIDYRRHRPDPWMRLSRPRGGGLAGQANESSARTTTGRGRRRARTALCS